MASTFRVYRKYAVDPVLHVARFLMGVIFCQKREEDTSRLLYRLTGRRHNPWLTHDNIFFPAE